jgi:hypothetical protein
MSDHGLPQITNSELIADLEAILLELRDRLDNYLKVGADDLIPRPGRLHVGGCGGFLTPEGVRESKRQFS